MITSHFLKSAANLPCGVDRTQFANVMSRLQQKEQMRIKTLTANKKGSGEGQNALGIEDFTLKTLLGRGGYGKVKISFQ